MASLCEQLLQSQVKTAGDSRDDGGSHFIPQNSLERILTEKAISQALLQSVPPEKFYQLPDLTQDILGRGKKLFSVLVLINREKVVSVFHENGQLDDSRLPFKLDDDLKKILGEDDAKKFYEAQWKVNAPILRHDRSHCAFDNMTVLPFVQCESMGDKKGGFGIISRVTLHPSHQLLVTPDLNGRAIVIRKRVVSTEPKRVVSTEPIIPENEERKRVVSTEPIIPENEERILFSLRFLKHPNIIALLASYSYRDAHFLLFPQADGDLEAFLYGKLQRPPNHTVLRELYGLSSAIETVHKLFVGEYNLTMMGCHHDLKPRNILVKGSKFLLTDFGLSRLESSDTASPNKRLRVEGFYYAPECYSTQPTVGPEADIWSFGCILTTIITFLRYGSDGVQKFEDSRKITVGHLTTKSFHAGGQRNPAVDELLHKISSDSKCGCLGEFKGLILQMLNVDPTKRPPMLDVTKELFFLFQKGVFEFFSEKFEQLQKLLDQTSKQSPNQSIYLEIERQRYMFWAKLAGLTGESQRVTVTDFQEFSSDIINVFAEIEDEIHFIESWGARFPKSTYFRLKELNDRLYAHLPQQLIDEGKRFLTSAMLDGKTNTELRSIMDARREDEYRDIGTLAEIKLFMTEDDANEVDTNPAVTIPVNTNPFVANPVNINQADTADTDPTDTISVDTNADGEPLLTAFDSHSLGTVSSEPVLIEWITYDENWSERAHSRVPKISKLFSNQTKVECSGLRVLQCKGYCKDKPRNRYGLIYSIPTLKPKPITLRDYIKSTPKRNQRPALGDLFELARQIVHCVLEVHKVDWIHRGISSYNIIFLPSSSSAASQIPITSPYLIGFSHSRRSDTRTYTVGSFEDKQRQYFHPDYLRDLYGFRPWHDFYSTGLVLLEIGRWRTLNHISNTKQIERRVKEIEKECEYNLPSSMGTHYYEAVKACLNFSPQGDHDTIRNEFEAKVVNRLAMCQA